MSARESLTPMDEVHLVDVGGVDRAVIGFVAAGIRDGLSLRAVVHEEALDIRFAFDAARGQHHSTAILEALLNLESGRGERILGIADVDLFIPIFTFVFGEAQLGGRAALISLARLRQEFYGLEPREDLLYLRAEKEAMHELGHTFGLVHCRSPECVMRYSSSVEEVDVKPSSFCDACEALRTEKLRKWGHS